MTPPYRRTTSSRAYVRRRRHFSCRSPFSAVSRHLSGPPHRLRPKPNTTHIRDITESAPVGESAALPTTPHALPHRRPSRPLHRAAAMADTRIERPGRTRSVDPDRFDTTGPPVRPCADLPEHTTQGQRTRTIIMTTPDDESDRPCRPRTHGRADHLRRAPGVARYIAHRRRPTISRERQGHRAASRSYLPTPWRVAHQKPDSLGHPAVPLERLGP